eukprot:c2700_g1_i1.p1 GENE.c2700_g1_i1~~c2700_g1_i1.p1  ORF type:complete len:379 (+),score=74.45 c2700_g1_i1:43-1179(+)
MTNLVVVDVIGDQGAGKSTILDHFGELGFPTLHWSKQDQPESFATKRQAFIEAEAAKGTWLVAIEVPSNLPLESLPPNTTQSAIVHIARTPEEPAKGHFSIKYHNHMPQLRRQIMSVLSSIASHHHSTFRNWLHIQAEPNNPVKCILFDLDFTLITLRPIYIAYEELMKKLPELMPKLNENGPFTQYDLHALEEQAIQQDPTVSFDRTELKRKILTQVAHKCDSDEQTAEVALNVFLDHRSNLGDHLFEDVMPTLQKLKEMGLTIGAVTNGNANIWKTPKLAEIFSFSITPADVGARKPDFSPFLKASRLAEVPIKNMVMVGDDIKDDIGGANGVGMRSVWINRTGHQNHIPSIQPTVTLTTLLDLPAVIAEWNRKAK